MIRRLTHMPGCARAGRYGKEGKKSGPLKWTLATPQASEIKFVVKRKRKAFLKERESEAKELSP